jgi:hypothetical protein
LLHPLKPLHHRSTSASPRPSAGIGIFNES